MAGVALNLKRMLDVRMKTDPMARARTPDEVPMATAMGLIVRERLTGEPIPDSAVNAVDMVRARMEEVAATLGATRWQTFTKVVFPIVMPALLTGFALYAEQIGINTLWYTLFGWVFLVLGESMTVRLWHNVAMWVVIIFSIVHMYMAIREDMTHRQTAVSSMISGWRFFR
jgi:thiosulfate reductase cytochrome b subunit